MVEQICNLLNLNVNAGLGRRLAEVEIKQDIKNSNLFYILPKQDVVEATSLAHALSIQVEKLHLEDMRFKPVRILAG
ncbi:MAG: hypothetical protein BroJett011_70690 [Chloroflexota bacterium]|nr:MAG: hypothetical protein BroJett011_70690 [Chloroflexota bacterium]